MSVYNAPYQTKDGNVVEITPDGKVMVNNVPLSGVLDISIEATIDGPPKVHLTILAEHLKVFTEAAMQHSVAYIQHKDHYYESLAAWEKASAGGLATTINNCTASSGVGGYMPMDGYKWAADKLSDAIFGKKEEKFKEEPIDDPVDGVEAVFNPPL